MGKYDDKDKKDQYQELTNRVISRLEDAIKYEKPWFSCAEAPYNPVTGTNYKGCNFISLTERDFADPRWYTFNNVKTLSEETDKEIHVRKGEKGTPVFKAIQVELKSKDGKGSEEGETVEGDPKRIWVQAYAGTVFNGMQIEGLDRYQTIERPPHVIHEQAELVMEAMIKKGGVLLEHHSEGRAFYQQRSDKIMLPHREQFKDDGHYYRTALHEFGHATGHPKRLNREKSGEFGTVSYAKEELVAELSSYFMGAQLGLSYDGSSHENHAAYLKSWLQALKNDKKFIFSASSAAAKATEFQLAVRDEYVQQRGIEQGSTKVFDDMMSKISKPSQERSQKKVALVR